MRQIFASLVVAAFAFTGSALADGSHVLSESDTGVVFGDVSWQITEHSTSAPDLFEDDFGYLHAVVQVDMTYVTDDGRVNHANGGGDVWFPTVTWNAIDQTWEQNGVVVATRRDFRTIERNPALTYDVWSNVESSSVVFKVQIKAQ